MYQISSSLSAFYKNIFPYLYIGVASILLFVSLKEDIPVIPFVCALAVVYMIVIRVFVLNKISLYVFLDKDSKTIIAYNDPDKKKKVGNWNDLIGVGKVLTWFTILEFDGGLRIYFQPKKYDPLLEEDDSNDIVDLLKKYAQRNRAQRVQ